MNTLKKTQYLFITAAVILFVGLMLPWVKAGMISVNGFDTNDGTLMFWLTILVAFTSFLVVRYPRPGAIFGGLVSLAALFVSVYDIHQASITHHTSLGNIHTSAGVGLYICALGSLLGLYAAFVGLRIRKNALVNS
jgi:hypothetical protein